MTIESNKMGYVLAWCLFLIKTYYIKFIIMINSLFSNSETPIFSTKAHVFHIDPQTKRSWIPASSSAVGVNFFYDCTRNLYRIISVEGQKVLTPTLNCDQIVWYYLILLDRRSSTALLRPIWLLPRLLRNSVNGQIFVPTQFMVSAFPLNQN